jgi:hypothetical protein
VNTKVPNTLGCFLITAALAAGQPADKGNLIRAALEFQQQGNYAEAESEFRRVLEVCEGVRCPELQLF